MKSSPPALNDLAKKPWASRLPTKNNWTQHTTAAVLFFNWCIYKASRYLLQKQTTIKRTDTLSRLCPIFTLHKKNSLHVDSGRKLRLSLPDSISADAVVVQYAAQYTILPKMSTLSLKPAGKDSISLVVVKVIWHLNKIDINNVTSTFIRKSYQKNLFSIGMIH